MYANGMCKHNNQMGYCPSCAREKSMRGMGHGNAYAMDGMGDGDLLSNLLTGSVTGAESAVGSALASSQLVQQAAQTSAANNLGAQILAFYQNNTALAVGLTVAVGALLVYGTMSFIRGK